MNRAASKEQGFALITALMLLGVLAALFAAYYSLTETELKLVKSSKDSQSGFNAAEAGLNLRAEEIRAIFRDYDRPYGTSPTGVADCDAGRNGSDDYICRTYSFSNGHTATTYVKPDASNPLQRIIPPGELFAGLSAQEYRYTVTSVGRNRSGSNEAILDLTFFSRLIPLFQFAIFFQEDLEFFNGATMTVNGPVHTNGSLYLGTQDGGTTNLTGQVSVAGTFYRGQKSQSACTGYTGTAGISTTTDKAHPTYVNLPSCSGSRSVISNVTTWKDTVKLAVQPVEVPSPDGMDSFSEGEYWQRADTRIVLRLDASGNVLTNHSATGVEVVDTSGNYDATATAALHNAACTGLIAEGATNYVVGNRGPEDAQKLRLYREYQHNATTNNYQRTLEVDMRGLLNCIQRFPAIMGGKLLSDYTEQGLVFYFAVDGPLSSATHNNYSVRIRNGAQLQSNISGAATVRGLTIVTDQGLVVWGNYNSTGWVPAALMGDTLWLLSNSWVDTDSVETDVYNRDGNATTVYAAALSGIKRTGDANGVAGQDHGIDTNGGGAINVFRFNEWFRVGTAIPDFTYVGSIVSLGAPRKSSSSWGPFTYYSAPNRVWSYETRFNDPDQLPPMTPTFVYLRQELFVRDYELD
ncbi:MAG: hypothetical protein K1X83_09470 [Oligoflexia bacterium]|nr:hypothetical protein [Oligoflexia bacterium]